MVRNEPCPKCTSIGNDTRGDNLVIFHNEHGHCFACGYHRFPKHYQPKPVKVNVANKSVLPADFTREVPTSALLWLLQFGLPFSYWQEHIGYSEKDKRLIFPIRNEGQVVFSIGRYVGPELQPKPAKKWYVYSTSNNHCEVIGSNRRCVVLVEDLISAHKVAASGASIATPLFGVEVNPAVLYMLRQFPGDVILWLDKDQEDKIKRKAGNLEVLINKPVSFVITDKDPKWLSFEQINKELNARNVD